MPSPPSTCACGCGETISPTATWARHGGHDATALSYVMWHHYGTTEDFIRAHGYGNGPGLTPIPRETDETPIEPRCLACGQPMPCDRSTDSCPDRGDV